MIHVGTEQLWTGRPWMGVMLPGACFSVALRPVLRTGRVTKCRERQVRAAAAGAGLSWGGPADAVRARCVLIRGSPGRSGRLSWQGRRTCTAGWARGRGGARDVQGDDASQRQLTHLGGTWKATEPRARWAH